MEFVLIVFVCLITLAVLCLVCWGYLLYSRRHESKQYDERQQKARLEAGRISDWFTYAYFGWLMLYLAVGYFNQTYTLPAHLLIGFGLFMKVMAYHIYCIFSHAALPLGEKPLGAVLGYAGLAMLQGFSLARLIDDYRLGSPQGSALAMLNVMGLVCFGFLSLAHLLTMLRKEKE